MYFKATKRAEINHTLLFGLEIHRVPLLDVYRKNSVQPFKHSLMKIQSPASMLLHSTNLKDKKSCCTGGKWWVGADVLSSCITFQTYLMVQQQSFSSRALLFSVWPSTFWAFVWTDPKNKHSRNTRTVREMGHNAKKIKSLSRNGNTYQFPTLFYPFTNSCLQCCSQMCALFVLAPEPFLSVKKMVNNRAYTDIALWKRKIKCPCFYAVNKYRGRGMTAWLFSSETPLVTHSKHTEWPW